MCRENMGLESVISITEFVNVFSPNEVRIVAQYFADEFFENKGEAGRRSLSLPGFCRCK